MTFENKTHYIIPGNNFIIDGAGRSLIYDLQRRDYDILPLQLAEALKQNSEGSFERLFAELPTEDLDFYVPFISNLVEKDYLIPMEPEELEYFSPMSTEWHTPHKLVAAILEYGNNGPFSLDTAIQKLDDARCQAIELRILEGQSMDFYKEVLGMVDGKGFCHVDMLIPYMEGQDEDFLFDLKMLHPTFLSITQYGAPVDHVLRNKYDEVVGIFRKTAQYQELVSNSGVKPANFLINFDFFLEALNNNTYFNGKIIIDRYGNISNTHSNEKQFGNIQDADLLQLMNNEEFRQYWQASKDNTKICRDCEYRYMCYDSRIPVKTETGEWEHTSLCNYDPFTCSWSQAATV